MANLAMASLGHFGRGVRKLPKPVLLAATVFILLALMALSFVVGRATIGAHSPANPSTRVTVHSVQPTQQTMSAADRLACRRHEQC
jgi:hypothetical protein